ncbi:MAG: amino acid ABC transporter substrate-binding protein [Deltaproteobacteria bacterium]|nr:amino acid ABC transporter substrate-binding protein [Deltaproteobacteria bacterium]
MRKSVAGVMTVILFFSLFIISAQAQDTLKIGVILPLTGPNAMIGQEEKRGIDMAIEKINAAGGALKKKVELIIEDNRGDPTVIVSAAEKLITRDKVVALTGGYSSVESLALLAAMKKYEPVTVWQGGGAVKMDQMYGKERWFFMLHPRSPDYQRNIADFLNSIQPKPKRIALAYEDTSYGVDHSKVAKGYLTELGFELVTFEPFKSGTLDFSPLLTKIKGAKPEIFYWVGYAGDSILITKQAKELGFTPKMLLDTVGVGFPEYRDSLKKDSEYVCGIEVWAPSTQFAASTQYPQFFPKTEDWVAEYQKRYNREPNYWSIISYVSLFTLTNAINKAGTTDKEKLITALEATDTMTPMGHMKFFKNQFGAIHQSFHEMVVFQWQKGEKVTLWPKKAAGGTLSYPLPSWDKR